MHEAQWGKEIASWVRKRPAGNFICRLNCASEKAGWEKVRAIVKTLHMTTIISTLGESYSYCQDTPHDYHNLHFGRKLQLLSRHSI